MGFPAGICHVTAIVTDVFNLFELCLQNLEISIDEWAIIFILVQIELRVIWGSNFGWSFHSGCPSFLILFGGWGIRGSLEIDFASQNGKLCSIRSGCLEWRKGTVFI